MPNPTLITDVSISELSLVFANKDGKAYRPINPEATVLSTKAHAVPTESLLGKYAEQLTEKASASSAQSEAELQVAYSTITSVFYSAIDALWSISYAPDSFSVEAKKDAVKTVIDNTLKSIKDASSVVLKAQIVEPTPTIAQPPFQAIPGDHPQRPATNQPEAQPTPVIPDPPTKPTIAIPEVQIEGDPKQKIPEEKPTEEQPKEGDGKAQTIDDVLSALSELTSVVKSQSTQIAETNIALKAKDDALAVAQKAAADAKSQVDALVGKAHEPTEGASAPRTVQAEDSGSMLTGSAPGFKAMGVAQGTGALETAISAILASQSPK